MAGHTRKQKGWMIIWMITKHGLLGGDSQKNKITGKEAEVVLPFP